MQRQAFQAIPADLLVADFRDHGLGHVAVYPSWPRILIAKLFQQTQNGVSPTETKRGILACTNIYCCHDTLRRQRGEFFSGKSPSNDPSRYKMVILTLGLHSIIITFNNYR